MTTTYTVTTASGELLLETSDRDEAFAAVRADRTRNFKIACAPDSPCAKHPAYEADNCPGCGTAARI